MWSGTQKGFAISSYPYLSTSIQSLGCLHTSRVVFLSWQCLQNCSGANSTCTKCCAIPLRLSCVFVAFLLSYLENPIPYKNHSSWTNSPDIPDLKEVIVLTMGQLFNKTCLERFYWILYCSCVGNSQLWKTPANGPWGNQPQQSEVNSLGITGSRFSLGHMDGLSLVRQLKQCLFHVCSCGWRNPVSRPIQLQAFYRQKNPQKTKETNKQTLTPLTNLKQKEKKPSTEPKQTQKNQPQTREGNSASHTAWGSQHFAKGKEQAIWAADSTSGKPIGKL